MRGQTRYRAAMLIAMGLAQAVGAEERAVGSYTVADYEKAVIACMKVRDPGCAEKNWRQVLRLRPKDGRALANLGILLNQRDQHAGAVALFQRAIDGGEGTYDLFAFYGDSLAKLGRTEEAITWLYRSLAAFPKTVNVRSQLAKLLVQQKRHYEALGLLAAADDFLGQQNRTQFFAAQRIAIESLLEKDAARTQAQGSSLRLSALEGHFFAPVTLGEARPHTFMVDTGASLLTFSEALLAQSKVSHKLLQAQVRMKTADGKAVAGQLIQLDSLRVGPYELRKVRAFVCASCLPLLGQAALERFDMKSTKERGVEALQLTPR